MEECRKMKKSKMTRTMCVFLAAAMLPLDTIVSLAAETAHTAIFGKSDEDVVQTSENLDIESVVPDSLDLICESESDTTVTLSWNNMFANGSGTYDIYLDSVLVQEDVTETTYTLTDLEAANTYDISVKAVNKDGEVTETSDDISVITDLVITKDTALWEETTVGNLYINGGTFNLNEQTLHVNGNVIVSDGTFKINGGTVDISGNLRIQRRNTDSSGNVSYSGGYGYLNMTNENDYVMVGGDFITSSYYSHSGYLTEGTLEVKGNFTQVSGNDSNFYASGNHITILRGDKLQTIAGSSTGLHFATLELQNFSEEGVHFNQALNANAFVRNGCNVSFENSGVLGWKLEADEEYNGDMNLIGGTLDLNGHKLTVNGNLTQSGGEIKVNGGELVVTGDYKIQTTGNGASSGRLNMTNEADKVTVAGTFATRSNVDHSKLLTAGTMTVGGNLYQYDNSWYNFKTSGTHETILNGTKKQTVSFESRDDGNRARFNILKITNTSEEGVNFATDVWVQTKLYDTESVVTGSVHIYLSGSGVLADNTWSYDLNINQDKTLDSDWVIGGSLYIRDYTFNLNGHKVETAKDTAVGYIGTLYINNGQLYVGRDLRVQDSRIQNDGTIGYDNYNYGYLKMTKENDFVKVERNFVISTYYSHNGFLTNGILEVKGNFTQITNGYDQNFYATGEHKVVLSGTKQQKINFASANSRFNILEINKPMDTGYVFNRTPVWSELIETAMDTQAPSAPKNLKSDLQTVTSISLKWSESTDNNAVTGYDVYRNGVRVGSTNKTEFIDDRLKSNTSYTYYVVAYDAMHNESDWSNIIEVKTLPDENAPTQPTGLKVKSQTSSSVVLNWTASTDNSKVEGYDVYRNDILIGTVNGTSFTDNSISSGLYVYYVKAFDDTDNYSEASEKLTVDTEPPTTPVLKIESSTNTQAVLSWNCTDNVGVEKYEIFRNGQKIATVTKNTYTDKNLAYDENYEYYVIAYDKSNNASEKSSTITVYTGEDTEAPTVTAIYPNANTFAQSISLTIYAKDNASVASITIEVSTDGEVWKAVDTVSANGSASTYIKYDLDISKYADGVFYVRAIAVDAKNNKSDAEQSPVIKYTVDNTAPSKLKNVKTAVVNGQLEIQWDEPTNKDVNYFRVYKSYSGDETFTLLKDKLEALNYFDTDIELAEMYDYYVTAVDYAGNESEKSEIVSGGISEDTVKPQVLSVVPKNGTKICNGRTMSISCKDNFRLGSILVEFAPQGTELWETMYTQNLSQNAEIVKFDLDMNNMADGMYDVRVQATDKSGNKSSYYTCAYDYKSYSIVAPKLFATERGWQIKLNWSSTTDSSLLGYNLYKRSSDNSSFVLVGSTILNEYTDNNVKAGQTYFYYVEAIDSYNNVVASEKVMAVPTDEDTVEPVADAGIDLYGLAGMSIRFDGSKSTDNHYIASYKWDFGDGYTANSAKATHTYSDSGIYTVTLTVKDSAGNTSSSEISVTVHDEDTYGYAEVQLVDSSRNTSVANAMVYAELPDGDILVNTNSNGVATVYAPFGTYKMSFYKDGYLPVSADITIEKGGSWTTVYIENGELVTGKIEVKRLDLQEIENLGIDTSAPENQYVYNYNVNVKTDDPQNPKKFQITVNGDGELINTDSWFEFNGVKFGILDMNTDHVQYVGVIPSTVPGEPPSIVLLDVSTTFTWLKEFFNVSLTVQNNASHEFYIGNTNAKITLPEGMSLAQTNTDNSPSRSMGTIYGGETSTVSWIVRGDTAGTYDIFADFSGILAPFNEPVTTKFKTDKPIKVYGGDALKLIIKQEYNDEIFGTWHVDFELKNVSDITIYNPSVNYSGYSEFMFVKEMTVTYPNGIVETIPWENGKADKSKIQRFLPAFLKEGESDKIELKPGECITGHYSAYQRSTFSNGG